MCGCKHGSLVTIERGGEVKKRNSSLLKLVQFEGKSLINPEKSDDDLDFSLLSRDPVPNEAAVVDSGEPVDPVEVANSELGESESRYPQRQRQKPAYLKDYE